MKRIQEPGPAQLVGVFGVILSTVGVGMILGGSRNSGLVVLATGGIIQIIAFGVLHSRQPKVKKVPPALAFMVLETTSEGDLAGLLTVNMDVISRSQAAEMLKNASEVAADANPEQKYLFQLSVPNE